MRVFAITISYAPAVLTARSLILYQKYRAIKPYRHIVVDGHYPINQKKNSNDLKLIVDCFDNIELWDPGSNLGSAQSQNYTLRRLDIGPDDVFINVDPDSACLQIGWDEAMMKVLDQDPQCILISCMAPMVQRYLKHKNEVLAEVHRPETPIYGIPKTPTPFNLSMWRYSFIKEIGAIPQMGLWWGETEGPMYAQAVKRGKYHAYLMDYVENELGKQAQDIQQAQWKDFHCRTAPPNNFLGNFEEFLRWKYPSLIDMDTCRDLTDLNFP